MPVFGMPDWAGTALTHGSNRIPGIVKAIAAGGSASSVIQFAKPGYYANIRPQYSGVSGNTPFCKVQWIWADANPKTIDIGQQTWTVPLHNAGLYSPVLARGPVGGPYAQLNVTNLDPGQPITFFADLWESTQHIARDDWRDSDINGFNGAGGFTPAPPAQPSSNKLASFALSVFAATTYILPLYAGQAFLNAVFNPVAGGSVFFQITDLITNAIIYQSAGTTTSAIIVQTPITLPRNPCALGLQAPATGGSFNISLNTMEYAS
jgi:hypothetical protein